MGQPEIQQTKNQVYVGMKFGTWTDKLNEMRDYVDKNGGRVATRFGESLWYEILDKNDKPTNGSLFIGRTQAGAQIIYNSPDGKYQFSGIGDAFTQVRAHGSDKWIVDLNGNGVVDKNEIDVK